MTDTEEAMQTHLDQHPDDHQARTVLADHLEEIGDPRAEGYRALGMMKKYPLPLFEEPGVLEHGYTREDTHYPVNTIRGSQINNNYPTGSRHGLPLDWHRLMTGNDYWSDHPTRREADDEAAHAFSRLPEHRRKELLDAAMKMSRNQTMRLRNPNALAMRYSHAKGFQTGNKLGGKKNNPKHKKLPPGQKKRPVTTWLTPAEIKHLKGMGYDAQEGIRKLVKGSMKGSGSDKEVTKPKVIKKSRFTGSLTELECLPVASKNMVIRRLHNNRITAMR